MQYLRVDTEALRQASQDILSARMAFLYFITEFRSAEDRLDAGWYGSSALAFLEEMRDGPAILNGKLELLDGFERILACQAEAWEESDQRRANVYRVLHA